MAGGPVPGQPLGRGERIGPFVVVELLGHGGMGHVYLASSWSGRPFAVKTIVPEFAEDPAYRRRFAREAELASRVTGVFTAEVVDADPDAPVPWMATAYVPAPSLSELVRTCGVLPEPAVRWLAAGVAEGLHAVHSAELIHRDVKPSNILVTLDGPRLIDFGIAEALDRTRTFTTLGTISYLAPEQARGEALTPASDIYSLGSTLVFAATGHPPHRGESPWTVLHRVAQEPPDLSLLPPGLADLVQPCLRAEPDRRPRPADVLAMFTPLPQVLDAGPGAAPWLPSGHVELVRAYGSAGARAARPAPGGPPLPPTRRYGDATTPRGGALAPAPPWPEDAAGGRPEPPSPVPAPGPSRVPYSVPAPAASSVPSPGPAPVPGSGPVPVPGPGTSSGPAAASSPTLVQRPAEPPSGAGNEAPPYAAPDGPPDVAVPVPAPGAVPLAGTEPSAPGAPALPEDLHRRRLAAERDAAEGRTDAALEEYAAIVDECVRRFGPGDRLGLAVRHDHAFWLGGLGYPGLALARYTDLVRDHIAHLGPDDPGTLAARHNQACCAGMAGDPAEAARLLAAVAADRARVLGPGHRATLTARRNLAHWTGQAGRPREAAAALGALRADATRLLGADHPETAAVRRAEAHWRSRADGEGEKGGRR